MLKIVFGFKYIIGLHVSLIFGTLCFKKCNDVV